jgi:hypothetical protein
LEDEEMAVLNGLVFDQLFTGKSFLNDVIVNCDIDVVAKVLGIPISHTKNEVLKNLGDKIKFPQIQNEEVENDENEEDEEINYFEKLKNTFDFENFDFNKF